MKKDKRVFNGIFFKEAMNHDVITKLPSGMKRSPFLVLLVALISLTFSSGKVFSMEYFRGKKGPDPAGEEAQARFQERRAEDGNGDASSAVARGVLAVGRGPSEEQEEESQDSWENGGALDGSFDGGVDVQGAQHRQQSSYLAGREMNPKELAYLYLKRAQDKRAEAEIAFFEAGQLDGTQNAYSTALRLAQLRINQLENVLQKAEQKTPSEQPAAFEQALEHIQPRSSELCSKLNSGMEDAAVAHERDQLRTYNALTGKKSFY
jgi:hypothetical protein